MPNDEVKMAARRSKIKDIRHFAVACKQVSLRVASKPKNVIGETEEVQELLQTTK